MEWAIFISKVADLKYWNQKYSRIYFGNEFCQRLLPSVREFKEVLDYVFTHNLELSFVSPYVTDRGLKHLESLLRVLFESKPESELIVNDWGILRINRNYGLRPVLGRLLTKQKRDPRILNLKRRLPDTMLKCLREASLNSHFIQFLRKEGIERVELDNLLQGIQIDGAGLDSLTFSLYFPYGYIATTRFCPMNAANRIAGRTPGIYPCRKESQDSYFILTHPSMPAALILKGNTIFFENKKMPENAAEKGINRVVYQPVIPI